MCSNKNKTARSMTPYKATTPTTNTRKSAGKTRARTKTRKHKFISLRRELSKEGPNSSDSSGMTDHHQLNLFPLHPENLFEEKDIQDQNDVACFFDTTEGSGATLNGLLWGTDGGEEVGSTEEEEALTCAWGAQDREGLELERAALRSRERDEVSEEKWVRYSEVVGKRRKKEEEEEEEEEMISCSAEYWSGKRMVQGLSLKLDYEEIMNAWMDKGPLYIEGEAPRIVPDVLDDALEQQKWQERLDRSMVKVPVMRPDDEGREGVDAEGWKMGDDREARVLRYKEKRQSRLFAKRIRYEVRKLNAEKRPRLKGRFVKRS